ncbi:MAG: peptide deformylase [Clostridia bacterium]|nr:peptide deformylase [Clostridia bacterium]
MAVLKILKDGDELLRKKSREVTEITPRVLTLLDDMKDTLHKANGAGLAAPQVGVLRRIVLIEVEDGKLYEMINPEIIERSEELQHELEGCLSIPGRWGYTERPKTVTVRAMDRNGKYYTLTGTDLLARAICHETDHLDGILYSDHARMLSKKEADELFG